MAAICQQFYFLILASGKVEKVDSGLVSHKWYNFVVMSVQQGWITYQSVETGKLLYSYYLLKSVEGGRTVLQFLA